ncbi:MAG: DUF805 domain-containing protein [Bacteroidota bacterium]
MFQSPFSFKGRIRRLEYGLTYLIYLFLYIVGVYVLSDFPDAFFVLLVLYIALLWFLLAQGSKRCHDLGNSGFYQLIPFYVFVLLFQEGQVQENKYGPNPKEFDSWDARPRKTENYVFETFVRVSSTVLLNTLLIAICIEYILSSDYLLFALISVSVISCYFLMLWVNYKGFPLRTTRKRKFVERLIYSCALAVAVRLYALCFGTYEIVIREIYYEFLLLVIILGMTYIPFLVYSTISKKSKDGYEL